MSAPIRVQLSRKKGWRMPSNTVKVDRTTKWGNLYAIGSDSTPSAEIAVQQHREQVLSILNKGGAKATELTVALEELRGKNLACWCPLDAPCHADVLLELANQL